MRFLHGVVIPVVMLLVGTLNAEASRVVGKAEFFEPEKGQALIYFVRPWAFGGSAATTFIFVGEQLLTTVDNGSYAAFHVEPGEHVLRIALQFGLAKEETHMLYRIQAEAEVEYFLLWRLNKREVSLVDAEEGRALVLQVSDRVEPTDKEREKVAQVKAKLQKQLHYSWAPGMFDVVTVFAAQHEKHEVSSREDLEQFVDKHRWTYDIFPESLGEIYAVAQLADLVGNARIEENEMGAAALFIEEAISGYIEATRRFVSINQKLRKKKWAGILGNALLATLSAQAGNTTPLQEFDVGALTAVKVVYRLEMEKTEKFRAEAERRLSCIRTNPDNAAIRACVEATRE